MESLDQDLIFDDYSQYAYASKGKRFANFIIDLLSFYVVLMFAAFLLGIFQVILEKDLTSWMTDINPLLDRLVSMLLYATYMSIIELIFKGKSLGKLITKTRAVNIDGTLMDTSNTIRRNFCRIIPFDQLSFLGDGCWHDKFSDTMVVDLKEKIIVEENNADIAQNI